MGDLYVSTSYGDHAGHLYRIALDDAYCPYGESCDDTTDAIMEMPAGIEDLAASGDRLWSVSESGGRYYQKRSHDPWDLFYPFIFSIAPPD